MPRKKKAPVAETVEPAPRQVKEAPGRKRKTATPAAEPANDTLKQQPKSRKSKANQVAAAAEAEGSGLYTIRPGEIMETPVFRPTEEEFADFYAYATMLDKLVGHVGVCKVIPPAGWKARQHGQGIYTRKWP
jgi:hypothetical protein